MRSRNIKPGVTKNEDLADLPYEARLLFCWLPMMADWEGRLEDRPRKIKAELLPFDNVDSDQLLTELHRKGFIIRYEVEGYGKFIWIPNFKKHQHPHKQERDKPSEIPEFNSESHINIDNGVITEELRKYVGSKRADSLILIPDTVFLKDGENGAAGESLTDGFTNTKPKKPEFDVTAIHRVLQFFSTEIRFTASNSANLHFIELALKAGIPEENLILSIENYKKRKVLDDDDQKFWVGAKKFFDPDHINFCLLDSYLAQKKTEKQEEDDNLDKMLKDVMERKSKENASKQR